MAGTVSGRPDGTSGVVGMVSGLAGTANRLTDAAVRLALPVAAGRAGAGAGVRFTERQLYHELCRVLLPRDVVPARLLFTVPAPVSYRRFRVALGRSGQMPGLLAPAGAAVAGLGRFAAEPDLFDYAIPRVLVCQDRAIAAMLLANDLHLEAVCPIFGESDLPDDPRFAAALRYGGDARVYVLHDASLGGFEVSQRIQRWVGGVPDVRIMPLGLRPRHAAALHLTVGRTVGGRGAGTAGEQAGEHAGEQEARPGGPLGGESDGLAGWERVWLRSGRTAEVAAVPPARLLRALHRLLRGAPRAHGTWQPALRGARDLGFLTWPAA